MKHATEQERELISSPSILQLKIKLLATELLQYLGSLSSEANI